MSDSRSAPLRAAWERARAYAAEHGVSVRKARSILAKQASQPKPKPAMQPAKRTVEPPKKTGSPDLVAAEKLLRAKYPHVIAGTLRAHTNGAHAGRRTVEIQCQSPGCKNTRLLHTSDLFQTSSCNECAKAYRSQKRSRAKKKGKK